MMEGHGGKAPVIVGVDDIAAATSTIRSAYPAVRVESTIDASPAADALVAPSAGGSLIVVGAHRHSTSIIDRLLGSTAVQVVTHSAAPVMVVHGPAPEFGDIVVGTDGSPGAEAAVAFAFAEADLRGTGITAVRVWRHPVHTSIGDDVEARVAEDNWAAEDRVLAETMAGWAEKYPDVTVRHESARGAPGRVLADVSVSGQLVVVGARSGGVAGRLLGSVGETLLHRAHCPTVVVPAHSIG